jgi:hypothetical protein
VASNVKIRKPLVVGWTNTGRDKEADSTYGDTIPNNMGRNQSVE